MKKILISAYLISVLFFGVFAASENVGTLPETNIPVVETQKPIEGLIILGHNYAVDENSVYVINANRNGWVKIPADRASFRVLGGQFARDNNAIYQMGRVLEGVDQTTFSLISPEHGYAQDDHRIYGPEGTIPEADPNTFTMLTKDYSMDAGQVYFQGKEVSEADSGSFSVIDHGLYAVDEENVFYAGNIISGISPEGFVVTGARAFDREGRAFFEGRIERGELPETDNGNEDGEVEEPGKEDEESSFELSALNDWEVFKAKIADYIPHITGKNIPFWTLVGLSLGTIFSLLFVFFAERNDVSVALWKSVLKTLIALCIAAVTLWAFSFFSGPLVASLVAAVIGFFFLVALWSGLGWIRSFLISLLTLIATLFLVALVVICIRLIFGTWAEFFTFITTLFAQRTGIFAMVGFFVGAWLIAVQLHTSLIRALIEAFISTFVAILILVFISWILTFGTIWSLVIFTLVYGVVLWILRFRLVSNLFVETVRIIRVMVILLLILALVVWILL